MSVKIVTAPLVNPNEPEALVRALRVVSGQRVRAGELLCILETTKVAFEVIAESDGYVHELFVDAESKVRAGDAICSLGPEAAAAPLRPSGPAAAPAAGDPFAGLRMTGPAKALAQQLGVLAESLLRDTLITTDMIKQLAQRTAPEPAAAAPVTPAFDAAALIIFGMGGHGAMVVDLIRQTRAFEIKGIIDDSPSGDPDVLGVPVIGGRERLAGLVAGGVRLAANAVAGLDKASTRVKIFRTLAEKGFGFPVLIHPAAKVEPTATLAAGAQVFAMAYVGAAARIGFGAIVNSGCTVSHHSVIGECAHIAPGAILAGGVNVGEGALIGMGAIINMDVTIGAGARIGNGARVHTDVPPGQVVLSGSSWPH
jgi:sugar O-acyltransferase (sialic acid O-acetyltransferase NeuD family)